MGAEVVEVLEVVVLVEVVVLLEIGDGVVDELES